MRDPGCYECRQITSGDCGKHGPQMYPDIRPAIFAPEQYHEDALQHIKVLEVENVALRVQLQAVTEARDRLAKQCGAEYYDQQIPARLTLQARAERAEAENARLRDCIFVAANTCGDVVNLGRFSTVVDPVRWVTQLKAHLDATLAAAQAPPQEPRSVRWQCPCGIIGYVPLLEAPADAP